MPCSSLSTASELSWRLSSLSGDQPIIFYRG
jgi:hypothetical protein